jgi:hypothetical protein
MNTKLIMTLTSILLTILGLTLSFAPDLVMRSLNITSSEIIMLVLQLLGAAYCAFALLNWKVR